MKRLIFLIAFACAAVSFGQTAYYDALTLRTMMIRVPVSTGSKDSTWLFDTAKMKVVFNLLRNYATDPATGKKPVTDKEVYKLYIPNEFIFGYFPGAPSSPIKLTEAGALGTLATSLGNLDVTTFADGLAKFLVSRGEEEITVSFVDKLKDYLNDHPEMGGLFPNTTALLNQINSWEYGNFLNTLREALDKDIKRLPKSIIELKDVPGIPDSLREKLNSDDGRIVLSALEIGNDLLSQVKLPDAIDSVADSSLLGGVKNVELRNTTELINIVSYSLRNRAAGKQYVSGAEIQKVFDDSFTMYLYFGLIWQQMHMQSIVISQVRVDTVFTKENVQSIKLYIDNLTALSDDLNDAIAKAEAATKSNDADKWTYYAAVYGAADRLIRAEFDFSAFGQTLTVPPQVNTLLVFTGSVVTLAQDISVRNYNAVVVDVVSLVNNAYAGHPPQDVVEFMAKFMKYGTLAANIVTSKNSDEVKASLEAFALPVGSASIKRHAWLDVSVNAYIGGFYGREFATNTGVTSNSNIYGMNAPVGLAISTSGLPWRWVADKWYRWPLALYYVPNQLLQWVTFESIFSSSTIYVSVLDVGAVTAYRASNSEVGNLPEFKLANIIAPGIHYVAGIKGCPISLGFGWQIGPQLRGLTSTATTITDIHGYRWSAFIAVDIPIMSFYTDPMEE